MATVTLSSTAANQPEAVEKGLNTLICKVSLSATASLDSVWRIGKLPHGAIPVDAIWYPAAAAGTAFVNRFGTSASTELFFASDSWAESGTFNYRTLRTLGNQQQISLSDDIQPRYQFVTMGGGVAIGVSVGYMGDLIVFYKMPGQTP